MFNEKISAIYNDDKRLTGDFLKPDEDGFDEEVLPHGHHVELLERFFTQLGINVESIRVSIPALPPRRRVSIEMTLPPEPDPDKKPIRSASKQVMGRSKSKDYSSSGNTELAAIAGLARGRSASKSGASGGSRLRMSVCATKIEDLFAAPAAEPDSPLHKKEKWWDPVMMKCWKIVQEAFGVEKKDGTVRQDMLVQALVPPEGFARLKAMVEYVVEGKEGKPPEEDEAPAKEKPSMEDLAITLKVSASRLQWLHKLFESFLVQEDDSEEPPKCNYPSDPGSIPKERFQELMLELKPMMTDDEFEARFRRVDEDGSGWIEFDEFATWVCEDDVKIASDDIEKMSLEDLADAFEKPLDVIQYLHSCFKDELPDGLKDNYPEEPADLPKANCWSLISMMLTNQIKKEFDAAFAIVDADGKGTVQFDVFLELIQWDQLPLELKQKIAAHKA